MRIKGDEARLGWSERRLLGTSKAVAVTELPWWNTALFLQQEYDRIDAMEPKLAQLVLHQQLERIRLETRLERVACIAAQAILYQMGFQQELAPDVTYDMSVLLSPPEEA